MNKHPSYFWICFWLVMIMFALTESRDYLVKAIDRNTAAIQQRK